MSSTNSGPEDHRRDPDAGPEDDRRDPDARSEDDRRGADAGQEEPGADSAGNGRHNQTSGLGAFIRMQRRLADLSLREMANLTSVSNAYLSQVERGLHQPSLRVLRSIAQALKIAPEDLLRRANFMAAKDSGTDADGPAAGPAPPDTEAAIQADPRLTPAQREALLNVYRSFRDPT